MMSHPSAIRLEEAKSVQLALARQVGMEVPETLITNDVEAFREFYARLNAGFAKSFDPTIS